ncbi:hypothetical protein J4038_10090 [Cellulomonas sp. zg-ZUI40]|nr:hypothetical protein [Cellulomonas dongxiuzhuiae]MBO3088630.1 hypothetical protein [Cellulomonas dongxiuzhuiae]
MTQGDDPLRTLDDAAATLTTLRGEGTAAPVLVVDQLEEALLADTPAPEPPQGRAPATSPCARSSGR